MSENRSKIKVLIVGAFPRKSKKLFGGQVSSCKALMKSSFIKKFSVTTLDSTPAFNFLKLFPIRLIFGLKRIAKFFLMMLINRPNVAIIFLANGFSAIEKGLMTRIAIILRVPVMIFPRAGGLIVDYFTKSWFSFLIRYTLGKSDLFLCQGKTFQLFATKQLGFSKISAPIIPNWTASKKHLSIGKNRNYKAKVVVPNILFLGWFENFKGVYELLEAARILRDNKISFHLTLAGNGTAMSKSMEFVRDYKLTKYITFTGWIDEKKKNLLLKNNQIFVLPSWSEGLPNAMIEAMSAGLACVVTKVGMILDYVTRNKDAVIIEKKNVYQLVHALKRLIFDHKFRSHISKNGYLVARKNFTIENSLILFSKAIDVAIKSYQKK
jgi:glycosyltransferase involved in cell wall biosynthesis